MIQVCLYCRPYDLRYIHALSVYDDELMIVVCRIVKMFMKCVYEQRV